MNSWNFLAYMSFKFPFSPGKKLTILTQAWKPPILSSILLPTLWAYFVISFVFSECSSHCQVSFCLESSSVSLQECLLLEIQAEQPVLLPYVPTLYCYIYWLFLRYLSPLTLDSKLTGRSLPSFLCHCVVVFRNVFEYNKHLLKNLFLAFYMNNTICSLHLFFF